MTGDFGGMRNTSFNDVKSVACSVFSSFSDANCEPPRSANFSLALDLFYEVDTAPVPLPPGLPLLMAGLGGLAVSRKRRSS